MELMSQFYSQFLPVITSTVIDRFDSIHWIYCETNGKSMLRKINTVASEALNSKQKEHKKVIEYTHSMIERKHYCYWKLNEAEIKLSATRHWQNTSPINFEIYYVVQNRLTEISFVWLLEFNTLLLF